MGEIHYKADYRRGKLQKTEVPLYEFAEGKVIVDHAMISLQPRSQVRMNTPVGLHGFSPAEAHAIGMALVEQAKECGYDEDTGETRIVA